MTILRGLLRLYPKSWRTRYEEEMALVLAGERASLRLALDLIAGAVDARLHPQIAPRLESPHQGGIPMTRLFSHCRPSAISTAEYLRSAGSMIGWTLALSVLHIALRVRFGEGPIVEAIGISAFPAALVVSMRSTYLKQYSTAAAWTMIAGMLVLIFAITLLANVLAARI